MALRSPRARPRKSFGIRKSSAPTSDGSMLEFESLNVYYGKSHVLRGLSLNVNGGEVVSLIGANAAGKTTTLRTALGLKEPASGSVRFLDADVAALSTPERV